MRLLSLFLAGAAALIAQRVDDLNFLAGHTDYQQIRGMLTEQVKQRAIAMLEARRARAMQWNAAEVTARKQILRERMTRALGGLPERTPLNARVTGVLERDGYRIEKIVFESQPRFYVTANLYIPKKGQPPYPGILFPLGHEEGAKAHSVWQQILVTLARNGYVALAWDTIGQGERGQMYDEDFQASKVIRSTTEHTILGTQTLLVGDALARYTVWDGIRALDYLVSRPEVDAKRIGCTGNSGGGTHTAYLSALDDRIQVAAPSCFITSWRRLLESIGPQDAEQCLPPWIADGLDHGDFIQAFAPKPYLMLSAIRDFFSITGARETYTEAQRAYGVLGAPEKIRMVDADDGHGYSKPRRLAAYRWFDRWLKGIEEERPEPEVTPETEEELWCTPTGQVATSLGGETVYSLNRKRAESLRRGSVTADQVRRLMVYEKPEGTVVARPFGQLARAGYRIEKLLYESEPGIVVPSLVFVPETGGRHPAVVFVHGRGKAAAADDAESLARAGLVVLAIDARGFGETRSASDANGSDWPRYFGEFESGMTALLIGTTLTGMRARDISRGVDLLAARDDVDASRIYGLGREGGAIPLLHAAAVDARLRRIALHGMLLSYQAVVDHRIHNSVFEHVIPGVLKTYDLPDLARLLAPRPVRIVDAANPVGRLVSLEDVRRVYPAAEVLRRKAGDTAAIYGFGERP